MYITFFLACIVAGSFAEDSDSSEAKYIDLLPEHEKKEFLDKIARRIHEEVQAKGGNNEASGEISEAKLEAQNEYVAKLLQEESKSIRRTEKNKLEDKDTQSSDVSIEKETKLKTIEDDKIDLTLREGKRSKRNKSKETSESEEKNTDATKTPENISVEIAVKDKNEPKSKEVKTEDKSDSDEKIPVKVVYDDISTSTKTEDTTKAALRIKNSTSIKTEKSGNTEISEFSPEESKDVDSIEPSKVESATVENESTTSQNVTEKSDVKTGMTERIYESIQDADASSDSENKSQVESNAKSSNESSSSEKSQDETETTVSKPNLTQVETSGTESLKDELSNTTQVEQPKELTPVLRTTKGNETKSVDIKENNDSTRRNFDILATTSKANSEAITSKDSEDNETTTDSKVLEKTGKGKKESLRHGFFENSAETQIEDTKLFDEIKSRYNKDKVQHYEVYEIVPGYVKPDVKQGRELKPVVKQERKLKPVERKLILQKEHPYYVPVYNYAPNKAYYKQSPDTVRFLTQERKLKAVGRNSAKQGNPHYVPVYNYAANNAFFNPYNRLGPNFREETQETRYDEQAIARASKNLRGRQKPKGANRERLNKKVHIELDFPKYFKPAKIKQQTLADMADYHFKDYYDMDFYYGRGARKKQRTSKEDDYQKSKSEKRLNPIFPNSDESSHPINKRPYKDHLSAIRQIMYQNKIFGYRPVQSTTTIPESTESTLNETESSENRSLTSETPVYRGKKSRYQKFGPYDWYALRSKHDSFEQSSREYIYEHEHKRPHNNPITFDYYFGTDEAKRSKPEQIIKNSITTSGDSKEKRYLFGSSDPADLLPTLDKLQSFKVERTNEDLNSYFKVLKDMVDGNSRALNQYDWLRTTVDVRSALKKLSDLSQQIKSNGKIHPADMELFKYIIYLHKTTRSSLRDNDNDIEEDSLIPGVIINRGLLPRNKHRGHRLITMKSALNRVWLRVVPGNTEFRKDINDFDEFLYDLGLGMYELHNAIKYISLITKYKNQRWYVNLKELYLSKATKKDLLGLLLHFSTSRLITLLEASSNNGLENGFFEYMEKNTDEVRKTKEEFLFVMRILDDFNEYY